MIKYVSAIALVAALSACSSSGGSDSTGGSTTGSATTGGTTGSGTTGGGTTGGGTTTGSTTGGPITPSGSLPGAWFGSNNFGAGVMIIDANENVHALAANGSGQYEAVFGPASQELQRFTHRDSDNPAFADSFTLAGDAQDNISYNLTVQNEGQQISNTGTVGDFTMTFATENDLPPISLADVAGDWTATTSFCPADCNITLKMTIDAGGVVFGSTQFNDGGLDPLNGTAAAATGSSQFLTVTFMWTGKPRTGVLYRDRTDTTRLVLNTVGPGDEGQPAQSFTASMIAD